MNAAGLLVRWATCLLPHGAVRRRYRQELLAELDALDAGRLRFGWSVLLHAWSSRRAVAHLPAPDRLGFGSWRTAPLHCRLHVLHHYVTASTDDGQRYRRCVDCGADHAGSTSCPTDALAEAYSVGYWY